MKPLAIALAIATSFAGTAIAAVEHGHIWNATYVAAYQPSFGRQGYPSSGIMKLTFNDGIISGTYLSDSIRPDPLHGRTIVVTGNVSHGEIRLTLQTSGGFSVRGTLADDGEISGTATIGGSPYTFVAKVKPLP